MRYIYSTVAAVIFLALLAPIFPVRAADDLCTCNCISGFQLQGFAAEGSPQPAGVQTQSGLGSKFSVGDMMSSQCDDACAKAVPAGASWAKEDSCVSATCWCKGSDGPVASGTTSNSGCKNLCSGKSQDFVSWGASPPSPPGGSNNVTQCPAGGIWTPTQCAAAKNENGTPIGQWIAPNGLTSGPYCYYNNGPIKLGVALGTLTQANISQYLAAAYQLGLGIAAALAVIFIMIGGFRYLSAAGGSGIESGKEMIKNAVIGLVLAALSFTLLQTVNPDILTLRLPSIQLIKQCDLPPVDCGSRLNKPDCENNTDPSKKCSWDTAHSSCIDLASSQSGTPGQLGGQCAPVFTCSDGSTCNVGTGSNTGTNKCSNSNDCTRAPLGSCTSGQCVKIGGDANGQFCSGGNKCEKCGSTADCQKGLKCISNMCSIPNTNNMPSSNDGSDSDDHYVLCTNAFGCTSDDQCATKKCGPQHSCITSGLGTDCNAGGNDACKTSDNFSCTSIPFSDSVTKKLCCTGGNPNGCAGCSGDGDCGNNMYCLTDGEYSFLTDGGNNIDKSFVQRCVKLSGPGTPCNSGGMCKSKSCDAGVCK